MLNINDVPSNSQRYIRPGTGYPEDERFTLQLIEILDTFDRLLNEKHCQVGLDAAFSVNTQMAKPSALLLHYNYGAAAVKWWGHHTDILQSSSQYPPHPQPSASAPRPSTSIPLYLRPPPTSTHDESTAIHEQHSTDESMDNPKAWESWDEDDWVLFCRLNTKMAHGHLQATEEESLSNIRRWAQDVADSQSTEL